MPLPTTEICQRINAAAWRIIIVEAGPPQKLVSFGTAFAVSPSGLLLTARHVISNGSHFYCNPIPCLGNQTHEAKLYRPITAADLSIDTGAKETKPVPIDLAVLAPVVSTDRRCVYLPLRRDLLEVGSDVIVAGYAKDITNPFFINELVDTRTFEGMDMKKRFQESYGLRQLFAKKTMIGARWGLQMGNYPTPGSTTQAAQYIYGTDLVEGASGGPVVDMDGRIAAVISRRGTADLPGYEISTTDGRSLSTLPTGSGTAFSHRIRPMLRCRPSPALLDSQRATSGRHLFMENKSISWPLRNRTHVARAASKRRERVFRKSTPRLTFADKIPVSPAHFASSVCL